MWKIIAIIVTITNINNNNNNNNNNFNIKNQSANNSILMHLPRLNRNSMFFSFALPADVFKQVSKSVINLKGLITNFILPSTINFE